MYVGIDVGGSKTLIALFDKKGNLLKQNRLQTPDSIDKFSRQLQTGYRALVGDTKIKAIGLGVPGAIDYDRSELLAASNLNWLQPALPREMAGWLGAPVRVANDALLGGWAEASLGAGKDFASVLYVTLSTGVGTSFIIDGHPQAAWLKSEGGQMIIQGEHQTFRRLENLVAGPAIKERFGKFGYEISDPAIWDQIARDLAVGLFNMFTLLHPEVIILSGGMSLHFDAFARPLKKYLDQLNPGLYSTPKVLVAANPETSVAYGCYLLAKNGLER